MGQPSSSRVFSPNGPRRDFAGVPVLIIEDETIIATDIALTLNDLGYETVGPARTHDEALALGVETKPRIIIADIKLSDGTSGIVAVDEILKSIDACVIFVTGAPEFVSAKRAGPCLVVSKPFSPDSLESAVAEAAKCSQTHQAVQETKWAVSKLARDPLKRPDAPNLLGC
jgi:DNA-binding NtrC family response regulator